MLWLGLDRHLWLVLDLHFWLGLGLGLQLPLRLQMHLLRGGCEEMIWTVLCRLV